MELKDRLKAARKMSGLKQSEVAKKIDGLSQPAYSQLESGASKTSSKLIELAKLFNVSSDWLATGNGEMTTPAQPKIRMAIDDPDAMPPALRDHLKNTVIDNEINENDFEQMMKHFVPVISWVAAGDMTPVMSATLTEVISWAPRLTHLSDMAFGLVVRGRSMLPEFKPDDVIYVEPTFDPSNLRDGDLVVVACDSDGEATFKQLVFGDNANDVYLKPLNPDWHNQEIRPMCECRLVGRVMGKYVVY